MDISTTDPAFHETDPEPKRPEFLKILCILSFIWCGIMILVYGMGTFALALDQETIFKFWDSMVKNTPQLENVDPVNFFHQAGLVSLYCLLATIVSLVGVVMMWRLEKAGFFVYAAAELITYFFRMDSEFTGENSIAGTLFVLLFDVAFIAMYAVNLKHMGGQKIQNASAQS